MTDAKKDLIRQAVDAGATLSDFLRLYVAANPPSERERRIIQAAQEHNKEGELEIDDETVCAGLDEATHGDYVLAWLWVEDPAESAY